MTQLCGAKTRSGRPCQQKAMAGGRRCFIHGGRAPQTLAKAQQRLAEQRARRLLADLGEVQPLGDPITALEDLGAQAVALTNLLRPIVANLEDVRARGGLGSETIRGELQGYLASMARAESILGRILSLGLDERRVRVQEAEAAAYIAALGRVLGRLGLDDEQQRTARIWLATELGVSLGVNAAALPAGGGS